MADEKINPEPKKEETKKSRKWCCWVIPIVIVVVVAIGFGVSKINKMASSADDKPAGPPKNYQYPEPSNEAENRNLNCNEDIRRFKVSKEPKKVLCLNLYKTSPEEIKSKLSSGSYDNIVLYGERTLFDVTSNIKKPADFESRFYKIAKFTDQITLPRMMQIYGLPNLDYVGSDIFTPYPAIYYSIRNQADVNKMCRSDHNIGGCSQYNNDIVLLDNALSPDEQQTKFHSMARNETDDHLYYTETVPSDCYVSDIITHETAHALLFAREMRIEGISVVVDVDMAPKWFNEQQAATAEVLGYQWVCGEDIVSEMTGSFSSQKTTDTNFMKFQSVYPPQYLGGYSAPTDCSKAVTTELYKYLSKGKIEDQLPPIISEIREKVQTKGYLDDDKNFANIVLKYLGNDPKEKEFLNSKGCGI